MKSKEELKRLAYENACCRCQYYENEKCNNKDTCVWKQIIQDLDQLEKIKSIVDDYEKYKLKPYKTADDYIRQIKEVLK